MPHIEKKVEVRQLNSAEIPELLKNAHKTHITQGAPATTVDLEDAVMRALDRHDKAKPK